MEKAATLSTLIAPDVKLALLRYCKRSGLKVRFFVENAILEQLEDQIDLEAYHARKEEETVPFITILKSRKKKPRRRER